MRIYELSKILNISSKKIIESAEKELNIKGIKNHMSSVSELDAARIQKLFLKTHEDKAQPKAKEGKTTENRQKSSDNRNNKHHGKDQRSGDKRQGNQSRPQKSDDNRQNNQNRQGGSSNRNKSQGRDDRKQLSKKSGVQQKQQGNARQDADNKGGNVKRRSLQKKEKGKKQQYKRAQELNKVDEVKEYKIGESIIVKDLAEVLEIPVNTLITKLISNGIMANLNQEIDFETAYIIAEEMGITLEKIEEIDEIEVIESDLDYEDDEKDLKPRPPIVTVMGHVDHGKTSLLDAIRNTNITDGEAGGITQHIGASEIVINDKIITFLDTPGHEAFTSMRSRGAQVTDIAILVVAADDGIMPQTIEAINHARAAEVPIIVAINKIDKQNANVDRVKQELAEQGLLTEDWGGSTISVEVSALKRIGIDELLEMVLLVAELEELKANPNRLAVGTIIEARLDKGRGPVATVLIAKGTLNKGDFVLTGTSYGKIRAMVNSKGRRITTATPSTPVEITGLSEVPEAGEILYSVEDEKMAKDLAEKRRQKIKDESNKGTARVSLEDLFSRIQEGEIQDLNLIVKADVKGSIEAIKQSLEKLSIEEVNVKTIHGGVGGINETDIMLASASNAIVIGFNVRPTNSAIELAKRENVDIRTYSVIYSAIEDIEAAVKGMLAPEFKETVLGRAEVRQIFKVSGVGTIAGIYVSSGKITRKSSIRLLRNEIVIHEGTIASLKRFKDDASELNTGYEGGLMIDKYNDLKEGDIIEAFIIEEIKR
ncbi:translation initiation factor IF-2 [Dethiosulfatibacter aminovorans DSM 17477]|uniref:Translation initiation factor IF-2 n=1 Tax=Dethiosulfatibacter aminovorans DSM 17477 TaxID=1121476 RepID=A0A1M6DDH6_9FIRM|nr:translation initiation factor IF-2 [Dethiosulfatibacter aminovorans]SHI71316.1 translation initiation factor IF-2 [Dethiosulfatibacter aminovorans DSM 17477]